MAKRLNYKSNFEYNPHTYDDSINQNSDHNSQNVGLLI